MITVFGLWHLGCVTAACCANHFHTIGFDSDIERINQLKNGKAPLYVTKVSGTKGILKTSEFGGGGSTGDSKEDKGGGTRGGRGVEVPSEGLFCVYVAMETMKTLDKYDKDNGNGAWKKIKNATGLKNLCNKYNISTMVSTEISPSSDFANPSNGIIPTQSWIRDNHTVMLRQAKAFCSQYKIVVLRLEKGEYLI